MGFCVLFEGQVLKETFLFEARSDGGNDQDRFVDGERYIFLSLEEVSGMACLFEENRYSAPLKRKGALFETTKKNVIDHGLGLKSISATVKKYGGALNISSEDNAFKMSILFPLQ